MADFKKKALESGEALVNKAVSVGISGAGPFKGAVTIAEEARRHTGGNAEAAVERVIRTHVRLAGTEGFVTGLPGGITFAVALPSDLAAFYILAARLAASIAHLRGYDVKDDEVRSAVVVCLLGASANEVVRSLGIEVGQKGLAAALKKVPGRLFIEINKKVGFRLITKAGETGAINMTKLVPFVGGPIGATTNALSMRGIAKYARSALPAVPPAEPGAANLTSTPSP